MNETLAVKSTNPSTPCVETLPRPSSITVWCLLYLLCTLNGNGAEFGLFEAQSDIGRCSRAGSATFDPTNHSYVISGGGENMWFTNDAFHFVWKQVSGNFALQAVTEWLAAGGNAHRKACLLVRQTLSADSASVDVAVHGDGLTSLQFREIAGGPTREIQAHATRPQRVGLERQRD